MDSVDVAETGCAVRRGQTLTFLDFPLDIVAHILDLHVKKAKTPILINQIKPRGVSKVFDWELQRAMVRRLHAEFKIRTHNRFLSQVDHRWIAMYFVNKQLSHTSSKVESEPWVFSLRHMVYDSTKRIATILKDESLVSQIIYLETIYTVLRSLYGFSQICRWLEKPKRCPLYDQDWICIMVAAYLDEGSLLEHFLKVVKSPVCSALKRRDQLCKLLVRRSSLSAVEALLKDDSRNKLCNPTLYLLACRQGKESLIRRMLKVGRSPIYVPSNPHKCYLCAALEANHSSIFDLLLEYGVRSIPNVTNGVFERCHRHLLHKIVKQGDVQSFRYLFEANSQSALDNRERIISMAVRFGNTAIIQELIDQDLLRSWRLSCLYPPHGDNAEELIMLAINSRNENIAYLLIANGFVLPEPGQDFELHKLIIAIHYLSDDYCYKVLMSIPEDAKLAGALKYAIEREHSTVLSELCRRVLEIRKDDAGLALKHDFSPVNFAVYHQYYKALKILLEAGMDADGTAVEIFLNRTVMLGTPLGLAVSRKDSEAVRLLLEYGADPLLERGYLSPLAIAHNQRNKEKDLQNEPWSFAGFGNPSLRTLDDVESPSMAELLEVHLAVQGAMSKMETKPSTARIEGQVPQDSKELAPKLRKSWRHSLAYRLQSSLRRG